VLFHNAGGTLTLRDYDWLRGWRGTLGRKYPGSDWNNGRIRGNITKVPAGTPLEEQFNYMLIYVHSYTPKYLNPAKEQENIERGIYYLHLGKMTTIVKSSTFNRMAVPYWREMKVTGQINTPRGPVMLQDKYDANVTLYGNNALTVGSLVFLDPTKDGATNFAAWKELGIGGFFLITEISHNLLQEGSVEQETSLKLRYVTAGGCENKKGVPMKAGASAFPEKTRDNLPGSKPGTTLRKNQ
jgi:hypothetical protein